MTKNSATICIPTTEDKGTDSRISEHVFAAHADTVGAVVEEYLKRGGKAMGPPQVCTSHSHHHH